jgi:hypothetical protein
MAMRLQGFIFFINVLSIPAIRLFDVLEDFCSQRVDDTLDFSVID